MKSSLKKTLLLGDFGAGSDAPIALDYRRDINEPSVIRLQWAEANEPKHFGKGNHWVEVAATFADFVKMLRGD